MIRDVSLRLLYLILLGLLGWLTLLGRAPSSRLERVSQRSAVCGPIIGE
jgi:hypothetical protein